MSLLTHSIVSQRRFKVTTREKRRFMRLRQVAAKKDLLNMAKTVTKRSSATIDGTLASPHQEDYDSIGEKAAFIGSAAPASFECSSLRGLCAIGVLGLMGGISAVCFFLFPFINNSSPWPHQDSTVAAACQSPTILRKSVVAPGVPLIPEGYTLKQATVHQRHLDRWMYQHDYIDNYCWPNQYNSTHPIIQEQCSYNLSSVWENFEFTSDPYSSPARGSCNAKQLTVQGQQNAEILGHAYRKMFEEEKDSRICRDGTIRLESDAVQKNQMSTQHVYKGICGKLPDPVGDLVAERVLDNGTISPGRPFFLHVGICQDSDFLNNAKQRSSEAFLASDWIPKMTKTVGILSDIVNKPFPEINDKLATLEDNIEDCVISHACHGLDDTPKGIWSILEDIDQQETASRIFIFDYFSGTDEYKRFVSVYFGYYLVTVFDRMRRVIEEKDAPTKDQEPLLYVQVTSDDRLSAILKVLDAPRSMFSRRPPWGSQIVFQLLEENVSKSFHVRMLFNGDEMKMLNWKAFAELVKSYTPTKEDCARFYENYP